MIARLATCFLIALVRAYQYSLSPFVGFHCRYQPTCSAYAIEALRAHGPVKGLWLAAGRLSRCHPWGGHGFDPVPPVRSLLNEIPARVLPKAGASSIKAGRDDHF